MSDQTSGAFRWVTILTCIAGLIVLEAGMVLYVADVKASVQVHEAKIQMHEDALRGVRLLCKDLRSQHEEQSEVLHRIDKSQACLGQEIHSLLERIEEN